MRFVHASALAALVLAFPFQAAGQGYRPSYENPSGSEIVAVYLTASACGPCIGAEMPELIDSVKVQLKTSGRRTWGPTSWGLGWKRGPRSPKVLPGEWELGPDGKS